MRARSCDRPPRCYVWPEPPLTIDRISSSPTPDRGDGRSSGQCATFPCPRCSSLAASYPPPHAKQAPLPEHRARRLPCLSEGQPAGRPSWCMQWTNLSSWSHWPGALLRGVAEASRIKRSRARIQRGLVGPPSRHERDKRWRAPGLRRRPPRSPRAFRDRLHRRWDAARSRMQVSPGPRVAWSGAAAPRLFESHALC